MLCGFISENRLACPPKFLLMSFCQCGNKQQEKMSKENIVEEWG